VPAEAAAELVERPLEALALRDDELLKAVPFGLELADPSSELLRGPMGCLGLA
jgi:hypothetical protein